MAPELAPFHHIKVSGKYPDILARSSLNSIVAVEAKGDVDLRKGFAQALGYKHGAHYVYLSAPEDVFPEFVLKDAKRTGVGILGVREIDSDPVVKAVSEPFPPQPDENIVAEISRGIENIHISESFVFNLNHPINYLTVPVLMARFMRPVISFDELVSECTNVWGLSESSAHYMIKGAALLGLIEHDESGLKQTSLGHVVYKQFPSISELRQIKEDSKRKPLWKVSQQCASLLQMLILALPQGKLIFESLRQLREEGKRKVNVLELIEAAMKLNRSLAIPLFLVEDVREKVIVAKGINALRQLGPEEIRGTTHYQFKMMLKHAGVIGGEARSGKQYTIEDDTWELSI